MHPLDLDLLGPGGKHLCCFNVVGQVESAKVRKPKYGNGSTEIRKYGSEKKSRLEIMHKISPSKRKKITLTKFSALLTHDCVC